MALGNDVQYTERNGDIYEYPVLTNIKLYGGAVGGITANKEAVQEYQETTVTATTNLERGQRLTNLLNAREGELQVVCDTGQTFVIGDAFLTGDRPDATGGEGGKIELNWAGGTPEEILS